MTEQPSNPVRRMCQASVARVEGAVLVECDLDGGRLGYRFIVGPGGSGLGLSFEYLRELEQGVQHRLEISEYDAEEDLGRVDARSLYELGLRLWNEDPHAACAYLARKLGNSRFGPTLGSLRGQALEEFSRFAGELVRNEVAWNYSWWGPQPSPGSMAVLRKWWESRQAS